MLARYRATLHPENFSVANIQFIQRQDSPDPADLPDFLSGRDTRVTLHPELYWYSSPDSIPGGQQIYKVYRKMY